MREHNLAGPLCFAGDYVAKGVTLPALRPGDFVVVHDAGASTLGLWSKHCSRLAPPVFAYSRKPPAAAAAAAAAAAGGTDSMSGSADVVPDAPSDDGVLCVTKKMEGESLSGMLSFWAGGAR